MAIHLVLHRPIPSPSAQLRIVWQGHRVGDLAQARWTDATVGTHRWPGEPAVRWIQRDGLRQGEEWKLNLPGVPADVDRIVLQVATTIARTVGLAVLPLAGDPNDAALHPGAELAPGRPVDLLELTRSGGGWLVTAVNSPTADAAPAAVPFPAEPNRANHAPPGQTANPRGPGWPGPVADHRVSHAVAGNSRPVMHGPTAEPSIPAPAHSDDQGPQVRIPPRLEPAVDAARGGGNVRRRSTVGAVVDLSASMRPWIVSGQLADVLTAVQAVAGASNRPSVLAQFQPGDQPVELALETEPAEALSTRLAANGLRTGDRAALLAASDRAARRGGLHILVTDDVSLVPEVEHAVIVLLGPGAGGHFTPVDPAAPTHVVAVPPGPVDVRRLARALADAAAPG